MIRVFVARNQWTPDDDLAFVGYPPLFRPHDQLYQPPETRTYGIDWRRVRRQWSRPAAYMTHE